MTTRNLFAVLVLLVAPAVHAQGVMEMSMHEPASGARGTMTVRAAGQRLALDLTPGADARERPLGLIFRGDRQEILVIDRPTRSYMVVDTAFASRIKSQLNATSKQFADQVGNLPQSVLDRMPADARAKLQDALQKMKSGNAADNVDMNTASANRAPLEETGETGRYGGASCRWFQRVDGTRRERICAARASDLAGGNELLSAMRAMTAFYEHVLGGLGQGQGPGKRGPVPSSPLMGARLLYGQGLLPVRTEEYQGPNLLIETEVTNARSASVPSSVFEPPDGFTRRDMITEMNGRAPGN